MGSDHINHKPFLLVLFIANKILNRHLTEEDSKSMLGRRGCGDGELYKVNKEAKRGKEKNRRRSEQKEGGGEEEEEHGGKKQKKAREG